MAPLNQKIEAEVKMRELLAEADLPLPDAIEYGFDCIRLFWHEPKLVLVVDFESECEDEGESDFDSRGESEGEPDAGVPP